MTGQPRDRPGYIDHKHKKEMCHVEMRKFCVVGFGGLLSVNYMYHVGVFDVQTVAFEDDRWVLEFDLDRVFYCKWKFGYF